MDILDEWVNICIRLMRAAYLLDLGLQLDNALILGCHVYLQGVDTLEEAVQGLCSLR